MTTTTNSAGAASAAPFSRPTAESIIADGLAAVETITNRQWTLGDLANDWQEFTGRTIAEYAESINFEEIANLTSWAGVAEAWPKDQRSFSVPWTCYRQLRGRDDRFAQMEAFVASGVAPTSRNLQDFLGQKRTPEISAANTVAEVERGLARMDTEDRVAAFKRLAADPAVVTAALDDIDTSVAISTVQSTIHAEVVEEYHEKRVQAKEGAARTAVANPTLTNDIFIGNARRMVEGWALQLGGLAENLARPELKNANHGARWALRQAMVSLEDSASACIRELPEDWKG